MMWKLAGIALAAAAIATAPVAGATNGSDNTPNPNIIGRRCTGLCEARQQVTNPTALAKMGGPHHRQAF